MQPMLAASRESLDIELKLVEGYQPGDIPPDLQGHVFFTSPSGTVNSQGLPYPRELPNGNYNREFGSPLINGDGMVLRFDFDQAGQQIVRLKTGLLKPPSYFADEATGVHGPLYEKWGYNLFPFKNFGISRMSLSLGVRNELNTALIPFQFPGDPSPRLLATYDAGRPFEIDPEKLEVVTPIGKNTEWDKAFPKIVQLPFPLIQSTAHPSFDPKTGELFTVNFTRNFKSLLSTVNFFKSMRRNPKLVQAELEEMSQKYADERNSLVVLKAMEDLHADLPARIRRRKPWWKRLWDDLVDLWHKIVNFFRRIKESTATEDQVFLMRWNGQQKALDKWRLVDEEGENIKIAQTMHQTSLSRDYIILMDSSFKFTADIMINNPFPHLEGLDRWIRRHTTQPLLPETAVYLVKRSELDPAEGVITARRLKGKLPLECIHFSTNYNDASGDITIYTANNSANCMAEWLRPFDFLAVPPADIVASLGQEVKPESADEAETRGLIKWPKRVSAQDGFLGMYAVGNMDVCRVGKFVIDPEAGVIKSQTIVAETGIPEDPNGEPGPHTWGQSLYTYRDIVSPDKVVPEIKNIYWDNYGLDWRLLTDFIRDLYPGDYPNRIVPVEEVLKLTKETVPTVLARLNTETMKHEDYYRFDFDQNLRSLQFVPRKTPTPGVDPSMDGYIAGVMVVNTIKGPGAPHDPTQEIFRSELWIFDASDLAKGPLVKFYHPEMIFAFPLHSAWLPEAKSSPRSYQINIREDYEEILKRTWPFWRRNKLRRFFNRYVYPHFDSQ